VERIPPPARPPDESLLPVSVVAHELRAPLASLAAASELLIQDVNRIDRQRLRDMLQVIRDGTYWLQGLVENLLCAASLQAGRFQLQAKPLNLLDVVMDIQPLVAPLLLQKGQHLRLAADAGLPRVSADRRWIGQTIVNLVANASKYSEANTAISIRIARRGNYLRTTVADRGRGLPAGDSARLFEPYQRGDVAADADRAGVGLGLAIVKSVVEAHGGRVGAQNRPKGGASIWFALVAIDAADTVEPDATPDWRREAP